MSSSRKRQKDKRRESRLRAQADLAIHGWYPGRTDNGDFAIAHEHGRCVWETQEWGQSYTTTGVTYYPHRLRRNAVLKRKEIHGDVLHPHEMPRPIEWGHIGCAAFWRLRASLLHRGWLPCA